MAAAVQQQRAAGVLSLTVLWLSRCSIAAASSASLRRSSSNSLSFVRLSSRLASSSRLVSCHACTHALRTATQRGGRGQPPHLRLLSQAARA
eukprot:SAG25_NODE_4454_length_811_cov_1.237360_1_plen_92_part_00